MKEAGEYVRAANPHLEWERLCGSGENILHATEGQTILCKSSWCAGTVKNYILAEAGVPGKSGEGLLELGILFYLSFNNNFSDRQAFLSSNVPQEGKKTRFLFPVMNSPSGSPHPQISFTLTKQFKAAFKHLRKSCNFVKLPVLGRNINDRLQVNVFLLPRTTNTIYYCWIKYIFM